MKKNDEPIIVEEIFNTSIESVWDAITKLDLMHQWYFNNIPDFKPEVGFETKFNVQSENRNFLHMWKITEVIPLKKIKYSWEFKEYHGKSTSAFELLKENNSTKLRVTVEIQEDFPEEIPEFKSESCIAGWKYFISERLRGFLATRK